MKVEQEIKSQKRKLREDLALITRFKLDLSDCLETISEPKALKESVTALYRKYVQGGAKRQDLDTDMQKEYNRQRDYLEKSVDSLKRKLEKARRSSRGLLSAGQPSPPDRQHAHHAGRDDVNVYQMKRDE